MDTTRLTKTLQLLMPIVASLAACAPQATEDYLGEPLLRMRGRVSVAALSASVPLVPALCFAKTAQRAPVRSDQLPAELQELLGPFTSRDIGTDTHIVDVETEGQFPAEFAVAVYSPPPEAALERMFSSEPRSAWGTVCAVEATHGAVAGSLSGGGTSRCNAPGEFACDALEARVAPDGTRFYAERVECPNTHSPLEDCRVTILPDSDPTLLRYTGGEEWVVGVDRTFEIVYLADPAPAGSFAAYRLGAPAGLPAGYHVRTEAPPDDCSAIRSEEAYDEAFVQANVQAHAPGEGFFPGERWFDEQGVEHIIPPEVVDTFWRVYTEKLMAACPLRERQAVNPQELSLTIDLNRRGIPVWSTPGEWWIEWRRSAYPENAN